MVMRSIKPTPLQSVRSMSLSAVVVEYMSDLLFARFVGCLRAAYNKLDNNQPS